MFLNDFFTLLKMDVFWRLEHFSILNFLYENIKRPLYNSRTY